MKITVSQLRRIIKEEVSRALKEAVTKEEVLAYGTKMAPNQVDRVSEKIDQNPGMLAKYSNAQNAWVSFVSMGYNDPEDDRIARAFSGYSEEEHGMDKLPTRHGGVYYSPGTAPRRRGY